eukprot:3339610-Karenia_brevis.AAC.1
MQIEVLPRQASTKYLGKMLSFHNPQQVELDNRISAAWRKFGSQKQELFNKALNLSGRLRLFDST